MANKGVVLVAGVGGGLGFGICRRFAAAGYDVAMVSRKQERLEPLAMRINEDGNGRAHISPADIRDEDTVEALFDQVEATHGPIKAAVFNTGAQHRQPFLDILADSFEKVWRLGCYAGFLVGRAAARRMVPRNKGSALSPEAIGQAYVDLHHQQRSAWSFEIDLRPWSEKF